MRAFELNVDQLETFFSLCQKLDLKTEQERTRLLHLMAEEKMVNRVWDTNRTKEQFIKDTAKHYKTLHVKAAQEAKSNGKANA